MVDAVRTSTENPLRFRTPSVRDPGTRDRTPPNLAPRILDDRVPDTYQLVQTPSQAAPHVTNGGGTSGEGDRTIGAVRALVNAGQRTPRGLNDEIAFVGMNPTGRREADDLARRSGKNVTFIGSTTENDRVTAGGREFDLSQRRGIDDFTRTLGLPEGQRSRVASAIERAGPGARDEMARLAHLWSTAEKGGTIPSRLVLSGHSVGDGIWGDKNGEIKLDAFRQLSRAMPNAASQIEDLHIAGCYSGGRQGLNQWRDVFPNAKTIWAYDGSAPGADSGSSAHLSRWERATRGRIDDLDPAIARGTRKGENVETWSQRGGYRTRDALDLEQARLRYASTRSGAEEYFRGDRQIADTQSGPLRDHYNNIQSLLQNPELPREERARLQEERDRTIRMIYYSKTVAPNFAEAHRSALNEGYRAVGSEAPDFARLSRRDALREIDGLARRIGADSPEAARRAIELLRGLRDLDSRSIPSSWVG